MKIRANGIDIEIEDSAAGGPAEHMQRPVVLLIMGLGMQLVAWPPQMVQALVDAGYRVIRMDNRDVGLSTHFDELGKPNLFWSSIKYKLGLVPQSLYTLTDMAADAVGVLDALRIQHAHVIGVSMGGMISQRVAIAVPGRVRSLTSIMSSSGARNLPPPERKILSALLSSPSNNSTEAITAHYIKLFRAIGSPGHPTPEADMRARILEGIARSHHPVGTLRQMLAVVSDITRAALLARVISPTLVLHGRADPLVPFAHGEDTARRIKGAKLVGIEGMGHDLPPGPVQLMLKEIMAHLKAADAHA